MHCAYSVLGNSSDAYLLHAHSIIHIFSRCPLHAHQKHVSPGAFCILISQHTLKRPSPSSSQTYQECSVAVLLPVSRTHLCRSNPFSSKNPFSANLRNLRTTCCRLIDWIASKYVLSLSLSPYNKCTFQRKKGRGQSGSWLTDLTIHFKSRRFHSSHVHRPGQWPL